MASFTNAKTRIPECFQRKIDIDAHIAMHYDANVSREGNLVVGPKAIDEWRKFKAERAELKSEQDLSRYSCVQSIKEANGP